MSDSEVVREPFSITIDTPTAKVARVDAKGNPWKIAGRLFAIAKEKLLAAIELPPRDEVVQAAKYAFDTYVAPYDVPVIPNSFEPVFDETMGEIWADSVGKLYDGIAKMRAKK